MQCNSTAIGLCCALKMNQWLGSRAAQPMAGKPARMGGASGYIMRAFAKANQISSPSETTSRYSIFAVERAFAADPDLTQIHRLSAARSACSSWSTYFLPLSSDSLFRELLYKSKFIRHCYKCRAVFVTHAGIPCTLLTNSVSVFHAWAPPKLKQHSLGRNVTTAVT